jgi:hypothetical protein
MSPPSAMSRGLTRFKTDSMAAREVIERNLLSRVAFAESGGERRADSRATLVPDSRKEKSRRKSGVVLCGAGIISHDWGSLMGMAALSQCHYPLSPPVSSDRSRISGLMNENPCAAR